LEIRRGEKIEDNKELIGYNTKIKIVKNKISAPFKAAEIPIKFKVGVDVALDVIEAASLLGLITKSGAFYTLPGKKDKIQGKEKLAELLNGDDKLMKSLHVEIQKMIKDMRSGKKVLADDVLKVVVEEEAESLD
jgi:recombination protein RecA